MALSAALVSRPPEGSRSRSHSRGRRRRDKSPGQNRKKRKKKEDKHATPAHAPQYQTGTGPPPHWRPFGYMPMPNMHGWGHMPGMPPPYGMGMTQAMVPHRSQAADDGVSMQVSEKFLMRNDYCQTFIDTGSRPQNFIRDLDYSNRYSEYPKIERLISLKDDILGKRATPAMCHKVDLKEFDLTSLGTKFDVILLDPPWEEYQQRVCGIEVLGEDLESWTMDELRNLKIGEAADSQSFCLMWCGQMHLEHGRELFKRWGFRRVEDIVWVKTNRQAETDERGRVKQAHVMYGDSSILQRTKEHCILGVKGTLKRSIDTHFIHANCDTDLIMHEEYEFGSTQKPRELYEIAEHFCLGRRRLELFGNDRNMRDGWLTLGNGLTYSNWNKETYLSWFEGEGTWPTVKDHNGGRLLGSNAEIEALRPKSPERDRERKRKEREEREGLLPEDLGEYAPRSSVLGQDMSMPKPTVPMTRQEKAEMKYK